MAAAKGVHGIAQSCLTIGREETHALRKQAYSCKQCASCREWHWADEALPGFIPDVTKKGFIICPIFRHSAGFQSDFAQGKVKLTQGLVDDEISPSQTVVNKLYQCTQCASCTEFCPQARVGKLDPSEAIRGARGFLFDNGVDRPRSIETMIHRPPKPQPLPASWIPEEARSRRDAILTYFPGCVFGESFKQQGIATSLIGLLTKVEGSFQVITDGFCCGYPAFTVGDTQKATDHARVAVRYLKERKIRTLVVGCAWGFRMIKREYPRLLGEPLTFDVLHAVEYLWGKVDGGDLRLEIPLHLTATYHDPCQLGRRCGVYAPPRALASAIPGLNLVEMVENRNEAMCCGGGGGLAKSNPDLAKRIGITRIKQAEDVDAEAILTSCPYCRSNLLNANSDREGSMAVIDIVEAVAFSAGVIDAFPDRKRIS
jgi:Fe-S oxidoreductase